MTTARFRMTRYYLAYARQHKDDWRALDGAQFEQTRREWAAASEGCAGLTPDEQDQPNLRLPERAGWLPGAPRPVGGAAGLEPAGAGRRAEHR